MALNLRVRPLPTENRVPRVWIHCLLVPTFMLGNPAKIFFKTRGYNIVGW